MKMGNILIQKVEESDVGELQKIGSQTFYETFIERNKASDMKLYIDEKFSQEQLLKEIQHPCSQFFFVKEKQETIAYLKLNTKDAQTEQKLENSLEVERIYVRASHQGKGYGNLLIEKALEIAKQEKVESIWLGVEEKNVKAVRFYEKKGFCTFDSHTFLMGTDEQLDLLMKLNIG